MEIKLTVQDILVNTVVGIRDYERERRQELRISVEIIEEVALRKDVLADVVDYSALIKRIKNTVEHETYNILEFVLLSVARVLEEIPVIKRYKIRVCKSVDTAVVLELASHQ